ncbi:MAG: hypothetical protein PHU23_02680 [Dehalococcoidales bacterium]|nr:hypothetical protein [Dehalococcoidales bacterium]
MRTSFWMGLGAVGIALGVLFFEEIKNTLTAQIFVYGGLFCFILAGIFLQKESNEDKKDRKKLFDKLDDIGNELRQLGVSNNERNKTKQ